MDQIWSKDNGYSDFWSRTLDASESESEDSILASPRRLLRLLIGQNNVLKCLCASLGEINVIVRSILVGKQ